MADKPSWTIMRSADLDAKFQQWRSIVDQMHTTTRFTTNDTLAWTPITKPLAQCVVALVSTAGVHLRTQPAFNLMDEYGDPSWRELPGDTQTEDIVVSHSHYDTTDANADPNVVFPLDRLRDLASEGTIGAVASLHIGMMGWNPDGDRIKHHTAPEIARRLRGAGVDVVVLTPG